MLEFSAGRFAARVALAACAVLAGCGGDDGAPEAKATYDDAVATVAVSPLMETPITRQLTQAGTYTLTLTGDYRTAQLPAGADGVGVWFSYSGQGSISGDAQPVYQVSAAGQTVSVSQSVTITTTGEGPWQVAILCRANTSSGTLGNLKMHTVLH